MSPMDADRTQGPDLRVATLDLPPPMTSRQYVLISACRNEEAYIDGLIDCIGAQTVPPLKWLIVDDGSTDGMSERALGRVSEFPFIQVVRMPGGRPRSFASQVYAAQHGHKEIVELLCKHKARPGTSTLVGNTPLIVASEYGHADIVSYLANVGVDVNAVNKRKETAAFLASRNGHSAVVKILLANGADIERANAVGRTAIMTAAERGHTSVVSLLLAAGAKVDTQDHEGSTALMLAVKNNRAQVAAMLLAQGAQAVLKDREGLTAKDLAQSMGKEMAKLFAGDGKP